MPPPELCHDLLVDILTRLPPDDPGCLFRASLVCTAWRALLTSPEFGRHYREVHRTPPLLGFFENHDTVTPWFAPSSPAASPFPPLFPDRRGLQVLDSRHGLVLLRNPIRITEEDHAVSLIVWDPVGRRQWESFPPPDFGSTILCDVGVVVCAADDCDHLGCHGSPFLVGYVGTDYRSAHASVFSSETNSWSPVVSCPHPDVEILRGQPKPLIGNAVYFICEYHPDESFILCFDLFSRKLSKFDGPPIHHYKHALMKTEEGVLGCASMEGSLLCLWSTEAGPDGAVAWMESRVIDLHKLLPSNSFLHVIGFEDRAGVYYLTADYGVATVDLKSGQVNKMSIIDSNIVPYTSFYTPDQAVEVAQEGRWEEVGDKEEEEADEEVEQQVEKAVQELFTKGSKALKDEDFFGAEDCKRRILEIRVAHHGKLSPKCRNAYHNYGCALLQKALSNHDSVKNTTTPSNTESEIVEDLDLAWKMLHVARAISEKSPGSTNEKYKLFAALARVSVERGDTNYSLIACFKALANMEHLLEPDHRHIINQNLHIRFAFELQSKTGDAKAISLCMSRVENLKKASQALLADKGGDASATEAGSENSVPAKVIEFFTNKILSALEEKLVDLEQAISTRVSEASAGADLEAAGWIFKRAKLKQTSVEDDGSNGSYGDSYGSDVDSGGSYGDSYGSDDDSDGSDGDSGGSDVDSDGSVSE
ncbi:uncharacterized protein LOC119303525 [Triticum dicoccoides]|uniref:uncharacterized protein LOC119303525 n=1 Tax=Triticum dicoccoides TaxID=85692 RepID=UPI00188FD7C8|nr:uncharacterized protein LOC119303525 [Triticum dicoccoides]